jgi:mannose-6-phosphate isomerase-like protein (cupin superfamily)
MIKRGFILVNEYRDRYGNPISSLASGRYASKPGVRFMGILHRSLKNLVKINLDATELNNLPWRDFSNGLFMARLAREGAKELVLYRIAEHADPAAFARHEHVEGEFYLVLKGKIADESGIYEEGDVVYLEPGSVHRPSAIGETVVLVLWPAGVRIVE